MTGLDRINQKIYNTYHSEENKKILPIFIFFSVIILIFNNFIIFEILLWGAYFGICKLNNDALNRDPKNLEERKFLLEFRAKILRGEVQFKE